MAKSNSSTPKKAAVASPGAGTPPPKGSYADAAKKDKFASKSSSSTGSKCKCAPGKCKCGSKCGSGKCCVSHKACGWSPTHIIKLVLAFLFVYLAFYTVNDVLCKTRTAGSCPQWYRDSLTAYAKHKPTVDGYYASAHGAYSTYVQPTVASAYATIHKLPATKASIAFVHDNVLSNPNVQKVASRAQAVVVLGNKVFWDNFHQLSVFIATEIVPYARDTVYPTVAGAVSSTYSAASDLVNKKKKN